MPDVSKAPSVKGVKKAAEIGYESLITVKVLFVSSQWSNNLFPSLYVFLTSGHIGAQWPWGTVAMEHLKKKLTPTHIMNFP